MAFVLRGEIEIDGRKGTAVLRGIQKEATKTSRAFDATSQSTGKLVASFLKANSAASVFGTSLRALGRFGVAGVLGAGAATALNRFGEAVKKNATDYFQAQKSLSDAFETSFKSKNVEEAQAGLARTREIADELRGKLTQLGALGNILGGLERLTGLKIFGVEDTKKALDQARKQAEEQEKIVEARKKEKEQIDAIEEATRQQINQRKVTAETLKLIDGVRKTRKTGVQQLELEVATAIDLRNENERILEVLEATNQGERNKEEIQKRRISRAQLELNIIKAQGALRIGQQQQAGQILGGSRAGRQALGVAERQKARTDIKTGFREEIAAVKARQAKENEVRSAQGLPILSQADIRKRMAAEAAGGMVAPSAKGVEEGLTFTQGSLVDIQKRELAGAAARQMTAPTDFQQRVQEFKGREAQKVMQGEAAEKKKGGYQKSKIRGATSGNGGGDAGLAAAIKALADKIPSAVPQ